MLVGNIVLMNFIIAVVDESYEACNSQKIAQSYKGKVDMIVEREHMMYESDFLSQEYFPNYIIIRRPVESDNADDENESAKRILEISKDQRQMVHDINIMKQEIRHLSQTAKEDSN
jgi:hypothetical protein